MAGLIGNSDIHKAGLVEGFVHDNMSWHKIVDIESISEYISIFGTAYTFTNQTPAFINIFCGIYNDTQITIIIENLSKNSLNKEFGVKIKYKKEGTHVKVWLYGSYNFIIHSLSNYKIIREEPDEDAIDANL